MPIEQALLDRAEQQCEICKANHDLSTYALPLHEPVELEYCVLCCQNCLDQISGAKPIQAEHFECLSTTMWSEHPAGFVVSTILIRMSFGVSGLISTVLIVLAVLFGLAIMTIHNKYEKNSPLDRLES